MAAKRWLLGVYACSLGGIAFQIWLIVAVWGLPWYVAAIFAAAIFFQGYLMGRSHGYHQGLWDNHTIYRDALRGQADAIIKATPPEIGETYTHLVTHRDRSN
jgi:hypothetical protein